MSDGKMKATVKTRFKELLAIKEQREERRISRVDVVNETGLSRYAIDGWANNTLRQTNLEDIAILSDYLGVDPSDLFVYSIEDSEGEQEAPEAEELLEAV